MRILVAVDGSAHSHEAVRALSHVAGAEALIMVYALDVPTLAYPMVVPEIAHDLSMTVESRMREEGERILKTAVSLLPLQSWPVSKRIEIGRPTDVILSIAEQERVDLITMGSRGVGAVRELILGSITHRVVTHAPCSTLVVATPSRPIRNLVLALEDRDDADTVFNFLSKQPFTGPCDATVLTVIPFANPAWPVGAMIPESLRKEMLAYAMGFVEGTASRLSAIGYRAVGVVVDGAPASKILAEASKRNADVIVMGSRHRGIGRLLGSVSHTVLHRTSCSVLVVRIR